MRALALQRAPCARQKNWDEQGQKCVDTIIVTLTSRVSMGIMSSSAVCRVCCMCIGALSRHLGGRVRVRLQRDARFADQLSAHRGHQGLDGGSSADEGSYC